MDCFADPVVYENVYSNIVALILEVQKLKRKLRTRTLWWLERELMILWESIMAFRPDEEICYDEFMVRIRRISRDLDTLKRQLKEGISWVM